MPQTAETFLAYERMRREGTGDPAWRLLTATTASITLSLLGTLFEGGTRRYSQVETLRRIERELNELRRVGADVDPANPGRYLNEMVHGKWIVRTKALSDQDEQCELSSAGAAALRFVESLRDPRSATNDSRLSMLVGQIERLNEESDENQKKRIEAKESEIARIRTEIEEIRAGRSQPLSETQALDRFRAIDDIRASIVGDFGRVREELMGINARLLERLHGDEKGRGDVVNAILAGVDEIAQSDAGRTATAFYRLISDREEMFRLTNGVKTMLERPFAGVFEQRALSAWKHFGRVLLDEGGRNQQAINTLDHNLKSYVVSREYRQHKRLLDMIRETHRRALIVKEKTRMRDWVIELQRTCCPIMPISIYLLRDPSMGAMDQGISEADRAPLDLEELARAYADADIDFALLRENVQSELVEHGQATIGEIIKSRGLPQGLASAMGYLLLAIDQGIRSEGSEVVEWDLSEDELIRVKMPLIHFVGELQPYD
jgi:hypothetical protein